MKPGLYRTVPGRLDTPSALACVPPTPEGETLLVRRTLTPRWAPRSEIACPRRPPRRRFFLCGGPRAANSGLGDPLWACPPQVVRRRELPFPVPSLPRSPEGRPLRTRGAPEKMSLAAMRGPRVPAVWSEVYAVGPSPFSHFFLDPWGFRPTLAYPRPGVASALRAAAAAVAVGPKRSGFFKRSRCRHPMLRGRGVPTGGPPGSGSSTPDRGPAP